MQPVKLFPQRGQRLLVAAARAHHAGEEPCDWHELAHAAGLEISVTEVNRALTGLAEAGLVEGVSTPSGWLNVRATARGLRRAGREGRHLPEQPLLATRSLPVLDVAAEPESIREAPTEPAAARPLLRPALEAAARGGTLVAQQTGAVLRRGRERTGAVVTPRVTAARTSVIQAWHVFTTFP